MICVGEWTLYVFIFAQRSKRTFTQKVLFYKIKTMKIIIIFIENIIAYCFII